MKPLLPAEVGSGPIWLDDVDCAGHEYDLSLCNHRLIGEHDCEHTDDLGLLCTERCKYTAKFTCAIECIVHITSFY